MGGLCGLPRPSRPAQLLGELVSAVSPRTAEARTTSIHGANNPVEIVAVSIDPGGRKAAEAFLRELNVSKLKAFADPEGLLAQHPGGTTGAPFILWGLPISFLVDRSATPLGYITGDVDWTAPETLTFLASCANA